MTKAKPKLTHADEMALRQTEYLTDAEFERFCSLVDKGNSPTAALMFASRRAPGVRNSDRNFNESARRRMYGMSEKCREGIAEVARRAGISTQGKFYVGGLGKYTDPHAWVSDTSDIMAIAKAKRLNVSGALNYTGSPDGPPPPKHVPLAPDVAADIERKYIQDDPKLREQIRKNPKKRRELRERVVATHGKAG